MLKPHFDAQDMQNIYLVGSGVYGNFHEYSDIDIVIISDTKKTQKLYSDISKIDLIYKSNLDSIIKFYIHDKHGNKHLKQCRLSIINIGSGKLIRGNKEDENIYMAYKIDRKTKIAESMKSRKKRQKNTLSELWGRNLINVLESESV